MAAFRLAREHAVPGVELDIHITADQQLIVIHDHNLLRTTGLDSVVEHTSYEAMKELDAGSWFDPAYAQEHPPLLEELFAEFGTGFVYDIEIKQEHRSASGVEELLLGCIRRFGLEDHCLVSSFNPFPLRRFARLAPHIPVAAIYSTHDDVPPALRYGLGGSVAGSKRFLKPHHPKVTRLWAWYHITLRKRQVLPWTVNDTERAVELLSHGVAGIVTDDPGALLAALGET